MRDNSLVLRGSKNMNDSGIMTEDPNIGLITNSTLD
jgi:hypothetical protein